MAWAFIDDLMNSLTSAPAASSTKLCAIAIFGIVPVDLRTTCKVSPGFAVIVVVLYFMSSPPVSSTVLAPPLAAAAGAAAAGLGAEGFGAVPWEPGTSATSRDTTHSSCISIVL